MKRYHCRTNHLPCSNRSAFAIVAVVTATGLVGCPNGQLQSGDCRGGHVRVAGRCTAVCDSHSQCQRDEHCGSEYCDSNSLCPAHDRDCDGVANDQDCDPGNAAASVGILWHPDCDADGAYGHIAVSVCGTGTPTDASPCRDGQAPDGGWGRAAGDDCDDENGDLKAMATDSDCDGACDTEPAADCTAGTVDRASADKYQCADTDGDGCDDCARGAYSPHRDGVDTDYDGLCDYGDPDDDNDGVCDGAHESPGSCIAGPDSHPTDPSQCKDSDVDGCDDCSWGSYGPNDDGPDADADGLCDGGDPDHDNDGVCDGAAAAPGRCLAGPDSHPTDPSLCTDADADGCDDCSRGSHDPNDDGPDADADGRCNSGDQDDDDDGVCDEAGPTPGICVAGPDSHPTDPLRCKDSEPDGCDDCSQGSYSPNDDGHDSDADGLCEPWALRDWRYRKPMTIVRRSTATIHHDFPVLVDLQHETALRDRARGDGYDILFTTEAGDVLHHEITAFDPVHGSLLAWVRTPYLDTGKDTLLFFYYGNQDADADPSSDDTWAGYHAVWHLDEEGNGAKDDYADSSGHGLHAQGGRGYASRVPRHVSGRIGHGVEGDGVDDFVSTPVQLRGAQSLTVTAWYNINSTENVLRPGVLGQNNAIEIGFYWPDRLNVWTPSVTTLCPGKDIESGCADDFGLGVWRHVAVVFDGNTIALYLDGVREHTAEVSTGSALSSGSRFNLLGEVFDADGNSLDGMLDEARIAQTARSAAWIADQYATQSDPSGFYFIGVEEPRR